MSLGKHQEQCLRVLADHYDLEFAHFSFAGLGAETGLDRTQVKRAVRRLARMGFAKMRRGLWTEDGTPAGSGYACTKKGHDAAKRMGLLAEQNQ